MEKKSVDPVGQTQLDPDLTRFPAQVKQLVALELQVSHLILQFMQLVEVPSSNLEVENEFIFRYRD